MPSESQNGSAWEGFTRSSGVRVVISAASGLRRILRWRECYLNAAKLRRARGGGWADCPSYAPGGAALAARSKALRNRWAARPGKPHEGAAAGLRRGVGGKDGQDQVEMGEGMADLARLCQSAATGAGPPAPSQPSPESPSCRPEGRARDAFQPTRGRPAGQPERA